ncbi:MAG: peptide deformylase [Nitrospirales bacterium]|nr:peptide deformylase [Nitrospirales bacterium]
MIRPILTDGHPLLRKVAPPVNLLEIPGPMIQGLLRDMMETMHAAHGIGLAAPQIGSPLRLVVMGNVKADGGARGFPARVLINPVLLSQTTTILQTNREGCLSVPGWCGDVARPLGLEVQYLDEKGATQRVKMNGLEAACLLHEADHLDGILFIDKLEGEKIAQPRLVARPEFERPEGQ